MICTAWSAIVVFFHLHVHEIGMPGTVHGIIGAVLGFLLVFRTNASYDRFWEGRKLWGQLTSENSNLIRTCEAFLKNAPEKRRLIAQWAVVYNYAMMNALRGKKDLGPYTKNLDQDKVRMAAESVRPPLLVAREMGLILQEAKSEGIITDYEQISIDNNIQLMIHHLGASERIRTTPLPFAYVIHLRRAMVLYCYSFPFVIVTKLEWPWFAIFGTMFLAFVYFGLEEIGIEIENPFGTGENDLPLESYCERIHQNIKALLSVPMD